MADSKQITFLVDPDIYVRYKIALLSLHRTNPEKYPAANPSQHFRRTILKTIQEFQEQGGNF